MAPRTATKAAAEKPAKKSERDFFRTSYFYLMTSFRPPLTEKSGGSGGKKKLTAFNKFMVSGQLTVRLPVDNDFSDNQQTEMARLRDDEPDISHTERFVSLS